MTAAKTITIYTKRWCGYCWAARRLFSKLRLNFEEIPLDGRPELRRGISLAAGGWPTVPMIFLGDEFIGGYTEAAKLHREGGLLRACGQSSS